MPLGALIGAIAPSVIGGFASAAAGSLASSLFGGKGSTAPGESFSGINAGGLSSSASGGRINVTSSGARTGLVGKISGTFPDQAAALAKLRMSVAPGMSALRTARLQELDNARRTATGDLRDNLARRRVLGSSFAQDALGRTDLAFAQQRDQVVAETFMQELQMTQQLTNAEFEARRGEFTSVLDELNLEANVATQLASNATAQLGANARLKATLDTQAAAGAGKFFGEAFGQIGPAVTKAVSGMFQRAA